MPGAPDTEPKGPAQGPWKVLSIGQFFFVKIWGESDLVSVAELQLLWEDKVNILLKSFQVISRYLKLIVDRGGHKDSVGEG